MHNLSVHSYTMRMRMAYACACAWQCHGHVHGEAMSMCMVWPRASAWCIYRAGILLANMPPPPPVWKTNSQFFLKECAPEVTLKWKFAYQVFLFHIACPIKNYLNKVCQRSIEWIINCNYHLAFLEWTEKWMRIKLWSRCAMCDVQFKLLQALMILPSGQTVIIKLRYSTATITKKMGNLTI